MGFVESKDEKRAARHNMIQEIIVLWLYYGHVMRKQGDSQEKEIKQGTLPGSRKRGRERIT